MPVILVRSRSCQTDICRTKGTCQLPYLAFCAVAVSLLSSLAPAIANAINVEMMTTNGRSNPLGIAANDISFAWALLGETRDVVQSAYQVRVGLSEGGDD